MHAILLLFYTGNWGFSLGALRGLLCLYEMSGTAFWRTRNMMLLENMVKERWWCWIIFTLYPNTRMGKYWA